MHRLLLVLPLLLATPAAAQHAVGGDATVEYRYAGADAGPLLDGTPAPGASFYAPALYVFGTAALADGWWATLGLQADHYGNADPNPVFAALWHLSWAPAAAPGLVVRAGRFAHPFGLEAARPLPSDNPFAHRPLLYTHHLRVDPAVGFFRAAPAYDGLAGQPVLDGRMHAQGVAATVVAGAGERLEATAALVSGAASADPGTALLRPGAAGRLVVRPRMWLQLGASGAYGTHARPAAANDLFTRADLGRYTQRVLAADATVAYAHYTVAAQVTWSRWRTFWLDLAPAPGGPALPTSTDGFALLDADVRPRATHLLVEAVARLPFLPGAHVGLRYERARFASLQLSLPAGVDKPTAVGPWMADRDRIEGVVGFRLTRTVRARLALAAATNDGADAADDAVVVQLNARF